MILLRSGRNAAADGAVAIGEASRRNEFDPSFRHGGLRRNGRHEHADSGRADRRLHALYRLSRLSRIPQNPEQRRLSARRAFGPPLRHGDELWSRVYQHLGAGRIRRHRRAVRHGADVAGVHEHRHRHRRRIPLLRAAHPPHGTGARCPHLPRIHGEPFRFARPQSVSRSGHFPFHAALFERRADRRGALSRRGDENRLRLGARRLRRGGRGLRRLRRPQGRDVR